MSVAGFISFNLLSSTPNLSSNLPITAFSRTNVAMSFLRYMVDMTFNLSQTVGSVELPIAATSGFHASLSNRSKALMTEVY